MDLNLLKDKPFYLNDIDFKWVKDTFNEMSLEEKIGQLFFLITYNNEESNLVKMSKEVKVGGVMCRSMSKENVIDCVSKLQTYSKIPMLISANLEAGGNGVCNEGTKVGSEMMISATDEEKYAKALGMVCAKEGSALGLNYAFAPVVDIDYNFRNPITNTRTFGSNSEKVEKFALAYMKECQGEGMACSIKHFPGDGRDERDQHLCTTVNDLSLEEWDKSYGKIYKTLIDEGAKTVMVGHIMQPAYSRYFCPDIKDEDIMPATLSKELLNNLLREKLLFNGLIITDASTMAGFDCAMNREKAVPYSIACGCDMFLFTKNFDEDFLFMKQGVEKGIITKERLDEAVLRILGLKASIGLHKKNNIPLLENAKTILGCKEHKQIAKEVADKCITIVKNKQNILPISKNKYKNILIYDIESGENAIGYARSTGVFEQIKPLLEKEGFNVARFIPASGNEGKTIKVKDIENNYDLIIYLCNLATKSNQTTVRIEWLNPMGANVPRYVKNIPTIFVSTENPYHLLDVPMVKTYINTYGLNDYVIESLVEKLVGKSQFLGVDPVDSFCGKWDTKI